MKKPELLSPAGNMESLYAAIEGGCDAIYLSGTLYGARSYTANFTNEQLKEAVSYAHMYNVKVYVTINTLIYEAEVKRFLEYVDYLVSIFVDAVIVQDIGMMDLLRSIYPDLEIHASTQMHIHNLEGVKLLEELGLKRVVLARETPIELISEIKDNSSIEIEIFVHGALCISYSGQCLMSSLIGGRSGNRGTCAQCCRQPYDLYSDGKKQNKEQYLLSTKDLNTLDYIPSLMDINVDSLKIEGRMKRPEYVYLITSLYRKVIDSYFSSGKVEVSSLEQKEIEKIFHRGFSKGFLFHEENNQFVNEFRPNHMGIPIGVVKDIKGSFVEIELTDNLEIGDGIRILGEKEDFGTTIDVIWKGKEKIKIARKKDTVTIPFKENVSKGSLVVKTTDKEQLERLKDQISKKLRKVPISCFLEAKKGSPIRLKLEEGKCQCEVESDFIVEESSTSPMTKERIKQQIEKLGGTVYSLKELSINMDDSIFIPIQKLNELRRLGIEKLTEKRLFRDNILKKEYHKNIPDFPLKKERSVYVTTLEQYEKIKNKGYDEIYIDGCIFYEIRNSKSILKIPRVQEHLKSTEEKVLVGELGSVAYYKDSVSDFSLNVVNSYSIAFLHGLGVRKVTLSYELNDYQIERMITEYHNRYKKNPCLEMIVSGPIEAMVMKYNLFEKYHLKGQNNKLVDKYHNQFPIKWKDGYVYIYHYQPRKLVDLEKYYAMGITCLRDSF